MKNLPKFLVVVSLVLLLFACKGRKKSDAELFHAQYNRNIEICIETAMQAGIDEEVARLRCACMLDKLYEIDSTIARKSDAEINALINANAEELMQCDSIR